jgi:hypothetical protein
MSEHWDEFTKSLAEPLPRRESLRRLGVVMAGALLGPLGMASGAPPHGKGPDPCKTFCKCKNRRQQDECLDACRACNKETSRLCGSCGSYACCATDLTCCGGYCTDRGEDFYNCGACGNVCPPAGPYEYSACIAGACASWCEEGAIRCEETGPCIDRATDPSNCGACGNVCPEPGPNQFVYCQDGTCQYGCNYGSPCDNGCFDLNWDTNNCGACGNVCASSTPHCYYGTCSACTGGQTLCEGGCVSTYSDPNNCGACGNVCGDTAPYCYGGQCTACTDYGVAACYGACIDVLYDSYNCGGCGIVCNYGDYCYDGTCYYGGGGGGYYGYWGYGWGWY